MRTYCILVKEKTFFFFFGVYVAGGGPITLFGHLSMYKFSFSSQQVPHIEIAWRITEYIINFKCYFVIISSYIFHG